MHELMLVYVYVCSGQVTYILMLNYSNYLWGTVKVQVTLVLCHSCVLRK